MKNQNSVIHRDPLTGASIRVQSVYVPTRTLLQGAPYRTHYSTLLEGAQKRMFK